ncbi:MAG: PilZ domain-containing protein [Halofilum sp. (in: g-proteobacteria)]
MNDPADRRAHPRVSIDAEVRVRVSGAEGQGVPCRMRDASQGGVLVITDEPPQTDRIWVDILTPSGEAVGDPLHAQVLRVDPLAEGGYRVACAFEPPAD